MTYLVGILIEDKKASFEYSLIYDRMNVNVCEYGLISAFYLVC